MSTCVQALRYLLQRYAQPLQWDMERRDQLTWDTWLIHMCHMTR